MIYLIPLVFGIWNGFVIKWKQLNDSKASALWHKIGRVTLGMVMLTLFIPDLPQWFLYVMNPVQLFGDYNAYRIILALGIYFSLCWSPYDMVINWVREMKWNYIGAGKDPKFHWPTVIVIASLTLLWAVFGNWFCGYIINY
jgi:hypothetical protein